jgi:hypothetical protein
MKKRAQKKMPLGAKKWTAPELKLAVPAIAEQLRGGNIKYALPVSRLLSRHGYARTVPAVSALKSCLFGPSRITGRLCGIIGQLFKVPLKPNDRLDPHDTRLVGVALKGNGKTSKLEARETAQVICQSLAEHDAEEQEKILEAVVIWSRL